MWIDGDIKVNSTGLKIRDNNEHKLNLVLFGGWYSNQAAGSNPQIHPASRTVRYIDDVAISNERIGCDKHLMMQ